MTAGQARDRGSKEPGAHATVSVTLDTYSHAIPAMQEAAALIAGLVFAAESSPRGCSPLD